MTNTMPLTATFDDQGRLVVPAEALTQAGIGECLEFAVGADRESGTVTLTAIDSNDDDSWAYSEQVQADIAESIRDVAEGRVFRMTKADLERYVIRNSE